MARQRRPATSSRIIKDPRVLDGEAIIAGTRIPVWVVVLRYEAGGSAQSVCEVLPPLSIADVEAALAYYRAHRSEIETAIVENEVEDYRDARTATLP